MCKIGKIVYGRIGHWSPCSLAEKENKLKNRSALKKAALVKLIDPFPIIFRRKKCLSLKSKQFSPQSEGRGSGQNDRQGPKLSWDRFYKTLFLEKKILNEFSVFLKFYPKTTQVNMYEYYGLWMDY
jgi:hypothetical protein